MQDLDRNALDRWITGNYGEDQYPDVELEILWENDWDVDHQKEFDCYENGGPTRCERAIVIGPNDEYLAVLGCIDDADDDYKREIEKELLAEAWEVLDARDE